MATKKSVKRAKKAKPAGRAAVRAAKKAGMTGTIIIASVIVVAAAAIGIVSSKLREQSLKKQDVISNITIKDTATGQEKQLPVYPASAGNIQAVTATVAPLAKTAAVAPGQLQNAADTAARVSKAAKTGDRSYLFMEAATKEAIPHIDTPEAKYLYDSGKALFVDARATGEYDQAHVKGAVSVPAGATSEDIAKLKTKLKGKVLVTYCHGAGCHLADKSAYRLFDEGYRNIAIFFGGWPKWQEAKYPIATKK